MGLILRGRRAKRHVPLAQARQATLAASGIQTGSSVIKVSDGRIIVQRVGRMERIIITTRDPYFFGFIRFRENDNLTYRPSFGGATGEAFIDELPLDTVPLVIRTQSSGYAGDNIGIGLASSKDSVVFNTYDANGDPSQVYVTAVSPLLIDYRRGRCQRFALNYTATARAPNHPDQPSAPLIQFEPFGDSALNEPNLAFVAMVAVSIPGRFYDAIFRIRHAVDMEAPQVIFPPDDFYGGKPYLARVASRLACAGRGVLLFFVGYDKDSEEGAEEPPNPDLIRLSEFGELMSVTPISALGIAGDVRVQAYTTFVYSGDDRVAMFLNSSSGFQLMLSPDNGQSWSQAPTPHNTDREIFPDPGIDRHPAWSLHTGHLEYVTSDVVDGLDDAVIRRYQSTDHGATWSSTIIPDDEPVYRDRQVCMPFAFDEEGMPQFTAIARVREEEPVCVIYRGITFEEIAAIPMSGHSDYDESNGEIALPPNLCFFGSAEFRAPLLSGHPGAIEIEE